MESFVDALTPDTLNDEAAVLKSAAEWSGVLGNGTDDVGFAGYPSGYNNGGGSYDLGIGAYWWTSTEFNPANGYGRGLTSSLVDLDEANYSKATFGFSVRCIAD